MKSEYSIWREEITRPKLTIAQRMAAWFERPQRESEPAEDPDVYRWWSAEELIAAQRTHSTSQVKQ